MDIDIGNLHPSILIWAFLSIPASGLLFLLTYPSPISSFHLFLAIMNIVGLLVMLLGLHEDVTEDSSDWEGEGEEGEREAVSTWWLAGSALVFIASVFLGLIFSGQIKSSLWVPTSLFPLALTSPVLLGFVTDVFGTTFSVVAGEENMKMSFEPLHKVFGVENIPYAFQPAVMIGRGVWSVEHVIKGQLPYSFGISVFALGIIMDLASAQSGTVLTRWLIHLTYNLSLLTASFLTSGIFTLIPSVVLTVGLVAWNLKRNKTWKEIF